MKQLVATLCLLNLASFGAVVVFEGRDAGAGPGAARPLSDAARDAFLAAILGSDYVVLDFESIPVQYSSDIDLTMMKLSQSGTVSAFAAGVTDVPGTALTGYNTTPGGERFLRITPDDETDTAAAKLTFDFPVEFFGAFYTGVGTSVGTFVVEFNNGKAFSLPVTGGLEGGVNFFGFTTFGEPITSVEMVLTSEIGDSFSDVYSVDDIITSTITLNDVPEPATFALAGAAIGAFALLRRRAGAR